MGKEYNEILKSLELLSITELEELQEKIAPIIATKLEESKKSLRAEFERKAQEAGYESLADFLGEKAKKPRKTRAPSKVSYQNPENPSQTWGGRGRKPAWVTEALEAGKTLDDLKTEI